RQKTRARRGRGDWWKTRIVPGSAQIAYGRPIAGVIVMAIAAAALMTLAWGGFYLDDPRRTGLHPVTWTMAGPATILLLCWLATARTRRPAEQPNYRILPLDFRYGQIGAAEGPRGQREAEAGPRAGSGEPDRKFAEFLDSL
ncbi:MAG: hypothetical protein PHQ19_02495, partial [Candidatus Krumholzibacteria bacterium]|nr:hypothetical protein [Candidatus Krumholzibacteria bacterium]